MGTYRVKGERERESGERDIKRERRRGEREREMNNG